MVSNTTQHSQRHIIRDRRRGTAQLHAYAACWARGKMKWNSIRWERKNCGPVRAAKAEKNLLYWHYEPSEPTKEGHLLYILLESPFASVSTVSRGHPSLVSLVSLYHLDWYFACLHTCIERHLAVGWTSHIFDTLTIIWYCKQRLDRSCLINLSCLTKSAGPGHWVNYEDVLYQRFCVF